MGPPSLILPMLYPGQQAQDEDSSDSEAEEPSVSQDPKDTPSQPSSTSHRPRAASCRATATWCTDSGSDDSRRWSDQLSLDEKDGFIFVNYSEGQARAHPQGSLSHSHPNPTEARSYSRLKPGNLMFAVFPPARECCDRSSGYGVRLPWALSLINSVPKPKTEASCRSSGAHYRKGTIVQKLP